MKNLKNVSVLLFFSYFFFSCIPQEVVPTQQGGKKYKNKYIEFLDKGSTFLLSGYNFMIEYSVDGKYIKKTFYPDTKQITHYTTFSDKFLKNREGLSREWWDNGNLVFEGNYKANKQEGQWKEENGFGKNLGVGDYVNGLREGIWKISDSDGNMVKELNYKSNLKNGPYKIFNVEGELTEKGIYKNGKVTSSEILIETDKSKNEIQNVLEQMPEFKGCENIKEKEERKECAENKMLHFIYRNIKYPALAREEGIQGRAYAQFVVDKDGKMIDLKILRGVCKEIGGEVRRVLEKMPNWNPGTKNGEPVKVQFRLPVGFKLQ